MTINVRGDAKLVALQAAVDAIQVDVDAIQVDVDAIQVDVDALADVVEVIELHLHNEEHIYGNSSNAMLEDEPVPFVVTGGDNAWGTELMITNGTVIEAGSSVKQFDLRQLYVVEVGTANKPTILQFLTSDINDAVDCTFDDVGGAATDIVLCEHGFENGEKLVFKAGAGALPAGLNAYTVYYVVNKSADYFQVSLTSGGAAVDLVDDGGACVYHPIVAAIFDATQEHLTRKLVSMAAVNSDSHPFDMISYRRTCNKRISVRAKSVVGSTIAVSFMLGLHVYPQ